MGGSFDPPHGGHLHVLKTTQRALGLDWIWVLPSPGNPLKSTLTPFEQRFRASRDLLTTPRSRVSTFEAELGGRYTIDLLRALKKRAPGARFVWIMGADNLAGFHRWKGWREIAAELPIAIVSRPATGPSATLSKFARAFANDRVPEEGARMLASRRAPAWTVLTARHVALSSSALRRQQQGVSGQSD